MKRKIFVLLTLVLAAVLVCGCRGRNTAGSGDNAGVKVSSQGAAYEMIVVCPTPEWNSEVGDTLRAILLEPVEMLNAHEPIFDVLRVEPKGFETLVTKHRNILRVAVNPELEGPSVTVSYDVYAKPQVVIDAAAPSDSSLTACLWENRSNIVTTLEAAERDRTLAYYNKFSEKHLDKLIAEMFGVDMRVPDGYKLRNKLEDFVWISKEYPQASQGFFIYSYPYTGREDFEEPALTAARNKFAALIPGENPGSHMTTNMEFEPQVEARRINGRFWAQMRGFWDVQGDFMGGVFVSFSTLDRSTNRVITIDCYVYSPKQHKRNYLRELENLIFTVRIPGDSSEAH